MDQSQLFWSAAQLGHPDLQTASGDGVETIETAETGLIIDTLRRLYFILQR